MKSHYVSVPLTTECRENLKALQETLLDDAKKLKLRSNFVEDAHLTLGVFSIDKSKRRDGETEEQLIVSVNKVLQDFLQKRPPLQLTFGELGNFGTRIVFINITNVTQLETLRQEIKDLLKEEGILVADNRFTPHVTLFRQASRGPVKPEASVQDLVTRKDISPVVASPLNKIVFQKLRE
ncbi:uncharacterized protein LOC123505212 isoform X2 [Portunus trituberculatus]|uniref:uncharacterized protein LOC123505212 isoform X2 n=1 Tax=Portunus trituberculatus TaxID=210409 RepID=UPI001E1CE9CD|nr:uncharacterized protein LOC123505212 isoform X2 [Portunus trituberculatus]